MKKIITFICLLWIGIILGWSWFSINQINLWNLWFDVWKFWDSFGIYNAIIGTFTLLFLWITYFHQKETLDEQTQEIRNQKFRDFIKFLLEWLSLLINNIQVRWHNQFYWIIQGESALLWLKYGGALYEGTQFSNIDKDSWLKHWWFVKFKEIVKSIEYIELYIEKYYKWGDIERKNFYYRLIKDRISYNLYELLIEHIKEEERKVKTLNEYLN